MKLDVNDKIVETDVESDTPLLWVLRDELGLTGTKFGCGIGVCGACTVHVDGVPTRSCSFPAAAAEGKRITTIEGLSQAGDHPVQRAWIEEGAPQCGYCQSGQIMTAAALLRRHPKPSHEEIVQTMNTHICRCGTYRRIVLAVERAARES